MRATSPTCSKHAMLVRVLSYLIRKPAPLRFIDTHAGIGIYDLAGHEASRTGEWRDGIGRLDPAALPADIAGLLAPYLDCRRPAGHRRRLANLSGLSGPRAVAPAARRPAQPLRTASRRRQDPDVAPRPRQADSRIADRRLRGAQSSPATARAPRSRVDRPAVREPGRIRGFVVRYPPGDPDLGDRNLHALVSPEERRRGGAFFGRAGGVWPEARVAAPPHGGGCRVVRVRWRALVL